jgi:(p)ppGpp synthase/HD superfamily hydrolase
VKDKVDPVLTARFEKALVWANDLFLDHARKGSTVPYMTHLLSVASLVFEDGGTEDEAIAALLHDTLEDIDPEMEPDIRERFGDTVAEIVRGCTDSDRRLGESSEERKAKAVAHIANETRTDVIRVSLADKLHNARCILRDLQQTDDQDAFWARFNVGREGQLAYYAQLVEAFRRHRDDWMVEELARTVARIAEVADGGGPGR